MGIRLGNFDPLQLIFGIMDKLLRSGKLTEKEVREILNSALPPEMIEEEKKKILDSMIVNIPPEQPVTPAKQ